MYLRAAYHAIDQSTYLSAAYHAINTYSRTDSEVIVLLVNLYIQLLLDYL